MSKEEKRQIALAARREYNRKWYKKNRKEILEYHKKWREENPDKVKAHQENYWMRKGEEMKQG